MHLSAFFEAVAAPELKRKNVLATRNMTNLVYPREYLTNLTEWVGVKDDIKKLLDHHLSFESKEFDFRSAIFERNVPKILWCHNEKDVVELGAQVYERPTLTILEECFNIHGSFKDHEGACILGDPDRVFVTEGRSEVLAKARFVLGSKTPWDLPTPTDMIKEFNEARDNPESKLAKAVRQIYSYMSFDNLRFGVLCNYEVMYLFRRDGDLGLQVSPPFRYSDRGTGSVVAALVYICHHVVKERSFHHSPVEQGPRETHILRMDNVEVENTWNDKLEIPWKRMNLYLTGLARRNVAVVISGEVRPQAGARFRYNSTAVFKVYDITTSENLQAANSEIQAYERLRALQGRYIPKLYAAGTTWQTLKFLILEDCGETVHADNIDQNFWSDASKAILALHETGFVHGDIKYDNFTISPYGVKLIDLGECRQGNTADRARELKEFKRLKREWDRLEENTGEGEDEPEERLCGEGFERDPGIDERPSSRNEGGS